MDSLNELHRRLLSARRALHPSTAAISWRHVSPEAIYRMGRACEELDRALALIRHDVDALTPPAPSERQRGQKVAAPHQRRA